MARQPNLSSAVRAKVNKWLELQPRGVQTRMAEYVGVKNPALSNYLAERRDSMRADNIGRIVEFLRIHAPELKIDVQDSDGLSGRVTPGDQKSPSQDHNGDGTDGVTTADLRQQLKERDEKIHDLQVALRAHLKQIREATDNIGALVGAPRHDIRKAARGKSKTS